MDRNNNYRQWMNDQLDTGLPQAGKSLPSKPLASVSYLADVRRVTNTNPMIEDQEWVFEFNED